MSRMNQLVRLAVGGCLAALLVTNSSANDDKPQSFRAILEAAEIAPKIFSQLNNDPNYSDQDWRLVLQVFHRLEQFRDLQPVEPSAKFAPPAFWSRDASQLGELLEIDGRITSVEEITLSETMAELYGQRSIFRCQLGFVVSEGVGTGGATILATAIPKLWQSKSEFNETVALRGVLVKLPNDDGGNLSEVLLLTNHIAWYPAADAPTGQLLLARHGMDVALLDEVRHRQPFVKPEVSREGEAFYAALAALDQVDGQELVRLSIENVAHVAAAWRAREPELLSEHRRLEASLASETDSNQRDRLARQVKAARNQRAMAAAILEANENQRSSVAPLFLQPEKEVGELVRVEGIARRAVWIEVIDQPQLKGYFEIELFSADSQNRRVVCCVCQLPAGFPTGDVIREPVQLAGVFFKHWRYRSRKLGEPTGQTSRQQQLYSPVLLGKQPTWLRQASGRTSPWALWGGVGFLGLLVILWVSMTWLARRDRSARAALRPNTTIEL